MTEVDREIDYLTHRQQNQSCNNEEPRPRGDLNEDLSRGKEKPQDEGTEVCLPYATATVEL